MRRARRARARDTAVDEGDARHLPLELLNDDFSALDRADAFSLGVSIHELATAIALPTSGDEYSAIRRGVIAADRGVGVSPALVAVVARARRRRRRPDHPRASSSRPPAPSRALSMTHSFAFFVRISTHATSHAPVLSSRLVPPSSLGARGPGPCDVDDPSNDARVTRRRATAYDDV